jgi:uncharacterized protein (TIGR02284 family)
MNDTIIPEVEKLIRVCRDGEELFRHAASVATSTHLKSLFEEYTVQRQDFAIELQTEVAAYGSESPSRNGSAAGIARRGWVRLRDAVFTPGEQTLLDDCQREGVSARDAYRSAIQIKGLPDTLRDLVARQYAEITAAHQYLRDLRDGSAPSR